MSDPRRSNGSRRNALRKWLASLGHPCWICREFGRPGIIDYSLPPHHPAAFEVDELVPVSKGGSPFDKANVEAAHRSCNEWRGDKSVEQVKAIAAARRGHRAGRSNPMPKSAGLPQARRW